jgi:hypothetical protein
VEPCLPIDFTPGDRSLCLASTGAPTTGLHAITPGGKTGNSGENGIGEPKWVGTACESRAGKRRLAVIISQSLSGAIHDPAARFLRAFFAFVRLANSFSEYMLPRQFAALQKHGDSSSSSPSYKL